MENTNNLCDTCTPRPPVPVCGAFVSRTHGNQNQSGCYSEQRCTAGGRRKYKPFLAGAGELHQCPRGERKQGAICALPVREGSKQWRSTC